MQPRERQHRRWKIVLIPRLKMWRWFVQSQVCSGLRWVCGLLSSIYIRSLGLDGKGGWGGGGKGSRTSWLREEKNKEDYDRDPSRLGAMKSGQLFLLLSFLFILEYVHRDLTVRNRNLNPRSRTHEIRPVVATPFPPPLGLSFFPRQLADSPVAGQTFWVIDKRHSYHYDCFHYLYLWEQLVKGFHCRCYCLPGSSNRFWNSHRLVRDIY